MKTLALLLGVPVFAATACEPPALSDLGPACGTPLAAFQADKAPKQPAPSTPSAPAKKPAPKERDARPAPPAHLFM